MVLLAIAMGLGGAALLVFGFARYRLGQIHRDVMSRAGMVILLGLGLIVAAVLVGKIGSDRAEDRAKLDESLVKMFGRAPDRLDLEGDRMSDFKGIAGYGGKRYRIEVRLVTWGSTKQTYDVTATPLDESH